MRTMAVALLAGTLGLGGVGRAGGNEDERRHEPQSVTMAELPPAAQATLKREAKGGQVDELRKQTDSDGTVSYEAEVIKDDKVIDLELTSDGRVTQRSHPHEDEHVSGEMGGP